MSDVAWTAKHSPVKTCSSEFLGFLIKKEKSSPFDLPDFSFKLKLLEQYRFTLDTPHVKLDVLAHGRVIG